MRTFTATLVVIKLAFDFIEAQSRVHTSQIAAIIGSQMDPANVNRVLLKLVETGWLCKGEYPSQNRPRTKGTPIRFYYTATPQGQKEFEELKIELERFGIDFRVPGRG